MKQGVFASTGCFYALAGRLQEGINFRFLQLYFVNPRHFDYLVTLGDKSLLTTGLSGDRHGATWERYLHHRMHT